MYRKIKEAKGDMRRLWQALNSFMKRKSKEDNEKIIAKNFGTMDLQALSNTFNDTFKTQIKIIKKDNSGPNLQVEMIPYQPQGEVTSFYLKLPTMKEILNIIKKLRKTGPGVDKIRPDDIKRNVRPLLPVITHLMRNMISTGRIPEDLKTSCITPIFKKGENDNVGNYRPIGAMSFFEKILEKFLENNMKKYLEAHQIIPDLQHGFQPTKKAQ